MIDPYEKIIKVIRDQGRTESQLFTGVLKANGKCLIGDLTLEPGEYSKLGNISTSQNAEVLIANVEDRLIILGKVVE